jgi:hypothetical protein
MSTPEIWIKSVHWVDPKYAVVSFELDHPVHGTVSAEADAFSERGKEGPHWYPTGWFRTQDGIDLSEFSNEIRAAIMRQA